MNKKRTEFIYQFSGIILGRQLKKASPKSKYAGQEYYNLKTILENQPKTLQVSQAKLTNPSLWEAIQQGQCFKRKYLFKCRNTRGYYYLVDLEEIPSEEVTN